MRRSATRIFHSAVRAWPSSSMRQRDDGGAVLLDDRHDAREAAVRPLAVLEVDRVDDRAAAEALQARLDDGRLGRVEHDRQRRRGGEPGGGLAHVDGAVAADVVDAQVDEVGALAHGLAADVDDLLPVAGEHRLAEGLAAVGVRALADHEHAGVLLERHRGVQRRRRRLDHRRARQRPRGRAPRSTTCRRCSGVVPQQPPTSPTPYVVDELARARRPARPGCSGYSAPCLPSTGRPAFGITDSGTVACCDR